MSGEGNDPVFVSWLEQRLKHQSEKEIMSLGELPELEEIQSGKKLIRIGEPHIHALVTRDAFTPEGEFLEVPEFDLERLQAAWQEAVFAPTRSTGCPLAEDKIEPEVVENMRSWPHSGFSDDQSVFLPANDRAGIERLVQYMTRCPVSRSRLVQVTKTGQVIYKAEKDAYRAFPNPQGDGLASGPKRNFQILSPLNFLAEFTQHIPPKGAHRIRYYSGTRTRPGACDGRRSRNKGSESENF